MVNVVWCFSTTPELPLLQDPEGDGEDPELEELPGPSDLEEIRRREEEAPRPLTPESLPSLATVSG